MQLPQIGDLIVFSVTLITQILLIRLFFGPVKQELPPFAFRAALAVLSVLWAITAFDAMVHLLQLHVSFGLPAAVRGVLYATGSAWGITAAASMAMYYVWRLATRRIPQRFSSGRRDLIRAAGAVAVASPFAVAAFGAFAERTNFHVREIDLPVPGLHPDLEGLRIAQVSDLHVSPFLSVRQAARVVDMTNELKPHLTVFTGDLISERGDPLFEAVRELGRLHADAGVLRLPRQSRILCTLSGHRNARGGGGRNRDSARAGAAASVRQWSAECRRRRLPERREEARISAQCGKDDRARHNQPAAFA